MHHLCGVESFSYGVVITVSIIWIELLDYSMYELRWSFSIVHFINVCKDFTLNNGLSVMPKILRNIQFHNRRHGTEMKEHAEPHAHSHTGRSVNTFAGQDLDN